MKNITHAIESVPTLLNPASCDLGQYEQEITNNRTLTQNEESELSRSIVKDRCPVARAQLMRANLRLVPPIARRFASKGISLHSLIQEGNVGLAWAIEEFNPDSGVRFSTWASWWIKHAIRRLAIGEPKQIQSIAS